MTSLSEDKYNEAKATALTFVSILLLALTLLVVVFAVHVAAS